MKQNKNVRRGLIWKISQIICTVMNRKKIILHNIVSSLFVALLITSLSACTKEPEPVIINFISYYPGYTLNGIEITDDALIPIKSSKSEEFNKLIQPENWKTTDDYPRDNRRFNFILYTAAGESYRFFEYLGKTLIILNDHDIPSKRKGYFAPRQVVTNGQEFLKDLAKYWTYPPLKNIQNSVFSMVRVRLENQEWESDVSALSVQQNIQLHDVLNMGSWSTVASSESRSALEGFDYAFETRDNLIFWLKKNENNIAILVTHPDNVRSERFLMPITDLDALNSFVAKAIGKTGPSEPVLNATFTKAFIGPSNSFDPEQYLLWKDDYQFKISSDQQKNIKTLLNIAAWKRLNYDPCHCGYSFALQDKQGRTFYFSNYYWNDGLTGITVETEQGLEYYQVASKVIKTSLDYVLNAFIPKSSNSKVLALTFTKAKPTGISDDGPPTPDDTFALSATQASILKSKLDMSSWKQAYNMEYRFGWGISHVIYMPGGGYIYLMRRFTDPQRIDDLKDKTWIYVKLDPKSNDSDFYMYLAPLSVLKNASDYIRSIAPK